MGAAPQQFHDSLVVMRGHGFHMGTFGRLTMPDGRSFSTLERPWEGNERSVSCIPPGVYELGMRPSEVVRRASGGRHARGWEVRGVPGRDYIMIHPGNTIDDSEGCILPGHEFSAWRVDGEMRWAVTNSRDAFEELMKALAQREQWVIEIRYFLPEYP